MICIYLRDWKSEAASHEALDVFSQVRFRAGAGAALWWREQVEIRNAIHWNTRMAIQDYFYNKIKSVIKYLAEFIIHMSKSFVLLIIESNVYVVVLDTGFISWHLTRKSMNYRSLHPSPNKRRECSLSPPLIPYVCMYPPMTQYLYHLTCSRSDHCICHK